jgi:diguanylate cyclase (GGDEF)-like protein
MQDVTELLSARSELERVAFVDPLTGMPNRARLRAGIAEAPVGSMLFAMDLDRFTDVNEAFGHGCGDEMIVEVARLLGDAPEGVTVARLGGDEFAILTPPGIGARDDLVARIFHALTRPVMLPNGLTLQASASMGIATKTKADMPADELLRQADVALNQAKRFRNAHEVYDARSDTSAPHRMMLLGELRRALTSGELELHHQPAVATTTGQICSVESKLVWRHPSLGLLTTEELTEMVNISNLHADIVMHSLQEAVAHYTAWRRAGHAVPVSINVNGATVHDTALVARIIELVQRADLPPKAIGIEIAEEHLMLGRGISLESLRQFSAAGIWVTIDHFGSAITSLSMLRRSHANALKLDRQGIADVKPIGGELMSAMIAACQSFGVLVAADGADTREEFEWLVELGADQVQGDFVGATVTFEEMQAQLASHEAISVRR